MRCVKRKHSFWDAPIEGLLSYLCQSRIWLQRDSPQRNGIRPQFQPEQGRPVERVARNDYDRNEDNLHIDGGHGFCEQRVFLPLRTT